jgi:mediator of RNA polymerase II transcription subunit 14
MTVGGDLTGIQGVTLCHGGLHLLIFTEFPREPTGALKRVISDEADARLAFYLPHPLGQPSQPDVDIPPRPQLPEGFVDTPLIRIFNFLRMCFRYSLMFSTD